MTHIEDHLVEAKKHDNVNAKEMRALASTGAKSFKQAWISLGQVLFGIWENKSFELWGFESFESYTQKELGLKKSIANAIIKNYRFVEDWLPSYLDKDFLENCKPEDYPDFDSMSLLRRAKSNKHVTSEDYNDIENKLLEKKLPLNEVRKDLTTLIKQRKEDSPELAREKRNFKATKKIVAELKMFKMEAEQLKIIPQALIDKTVELMKEISSHIDS